MSAFNFGGECQFGNHGEPFLWHGSENDDISIAMIQLMELAELDEKLALEIADEISACLSRRRTKGAPDARESGAKKVTSKTKKAVKPARG